MQNNLFQDQKFRGILYQTLVVGFFALGLYFVINTTAYNLEKRNIATGFGFLNNPAGFDISFSPFLDFKSTDTHLKVYFVGVLNTRCVDARTFLLKKNKNNYYLLGQGDPDLNYEDIIELISNIKENKTINLNFLCPLKLNSSIRFLISF